MNQSQQQQQQFGMRESFNLFYAAAKIHAYCFFPFLRRDFGTQALGFPALFAAVLMLLVGAFGRIPEMFLFLGLWLVVLICQRLRTWQLVRKGVIWHSRYEGYPWLTIWIPFVRTEARARFIEPLICLWAGMVLFQVAPGLGMFVMAGFISMTVVESIHIDLERKRLEAMHDAEIEQRWLAARYRGQTHE